MKTNSINSSFRGPVLPLFLFLSFALLLAAGCSRSPAPPDTSASKNALAQAAGKKWKLDRWTGVDGSLQTPGAITLEIDASLRASGNASVNRYSGPVKFTDTGAADFSTGFIVTKMMGLPEPQAREGRYLAELAKIRAVAFAGGRLVLTGEGKLRMEFAPAPAQ